MSSVQKFVLSNGVRVLVENVSHVQSAAIGIWCQTGSRLERENQEGISHLIEHMLFKGTEKRTAEQIAQEIEGRGGHLNAFTDREQTCYYARVLAEDAIHALDVLSDMIIRARLRKEDLELEKSVVQEEIKKYEDSPEDLVHDLHARNRWGAHPLGKPIIGTHDSVGGFNPSDLKEYMTERYCAGKTLVSIAGNVNAEKFRDACEEKLSELRNDFELPVEPPPLSNSGEFVTKKPVEQVHFCVGGDCINLLDERRATVSIMDAILGGSMSSRLFQEIREKRGLVYAIGSYSALYREAGSFVIYGGTSPSQWEQVKELILKELAKIRNEPVSVEELERTKQMIKGSIVLALEGMSSRMHRMARNEMVFGRDIPIEETIAKIDAVTPKNIQSLANEFLDEGDLTTTLIGSIET